MLSDVLFEVLKDRRGRSMVSKSSINAVPVALAVVSDWEGGL